MNISRRSLQRILKLVHAFPYKITTVQPLKEASQEQRKVFAVKVLQMIDRGEIDQHHIWWSDEAHFHVSGYVNTQNFRIWGTENPH